MNYLESYRPREISEIAKDEAPSVENPFDMAVDILNRYGQNIPQEDKDLTLKRVGDAVREWNASPEDLNNTADAAFLIHSRRTADSPDYLDDPGKYFPALSVKYGIPYEEIERLWNILPPFEVGRIQGTLASGEEINIAIISTQITPQKLEEASGPSQRMNYARPRVKDAVSLAKKKGATTVGLGETLASLTRHAQLLEKEQDFKGINFATGHAFTTYFIGEWTKYAAQLRKEELKDTSVTILGAAGSIGSSTAWMLADAGVGKLVLHDKLEFAKNLEVTGVDLLDYYPEIVIETTSKEWDDPLKEACKRSNIIVCATSNPEPFIKAEHLKRGSIIVNDSQPPGITLSEAQKAGSISPWVVGKLPEGLEDTFDSGLVDAEWTCAIEVIAKILDPSLPTSGPVTLERVERAAEICKRYGFTLAEPQAFGEKFSIETITNELDTPEMASVH